RDAGIEKPAHLLGVLFAILLVEELVVFTLIDGPLRRLLVNSCETHTLDQERHRRKHHVGPSNRCLHGISSEMETVPAASGHGPRHPFAAMPAKGDTGDYHSQLPYAMMSPFLPCPRRQPATFRITHSRGPRRATVFHRQDNNTAAPKNNRPYP